MHLAAHIDALHTARQFPHSVQIVAGAGGKQIVGRTAFQQHFGHSHFAIAPWRDRFLQSGVAVLAIALESDFRVRAIVEQQLNQRRGLETAPIGWPIQQRDIVRPARMRIGQPGRVVGPCLEQYA